MRIRSGRAMRSSISPTIGALPTTSPSSSSASADADGRIVAMDVEVTKEDTLAIVRVRGFLDTKSSAEFEKHVLVLLMGGSKAFAMDFSKLDMITSAGIRILMMAVKRLGGPDRVALWGLNEQIKVVFQIAGLAGVFQTFDSQQAAIDH